MAAAAEGNEFEAFATGPFVAGGVGLATGAGRRVTDAVAWLTTDAGAVLASASGAFVAGVVGLATGAGRRAAGGAVVFVAGDAEGLASASGARRAATVFAPATRRFAASDSGTFAGAPGFRVTAAIAVPLGPGARVAPAARRLIVFAVVAG